MYFSSLLNVLNSLGELKNLQLISIQILLENAWDEQMVKEKFKKAEETIYQKFHGVSRRIYIVDRNYGFTIRKNLIPDKTPVLPLVESLNLLLSYNILTCASKFNGNVKSKILTVSMQQQTETISLI